MTTENHSSLITDRESLIHESLIHESLIHESLIHESLNRRILDPIQRLGDSIPGVENSGFEDERVAISDQ